MDGPRVKVLSDGAELHDASTISPDHAVVSEPLLATQIEVLRGPSALVYGNGAVGGVVNVLDGKIPTAVPQKGYEGSAELRANSGASEKAGAFSLTGGTGNLAVHVEGVARDAGDYRVGKGWAPEAEPTRKVLGSFNRTDTGSVGLSWVGDQGYLGAAYTRQTAKYGLPGHNHSFDGCHTHGDHLHCGAHADDEAGGHDHDHDAAAGDVPVVQLASKRFDIRGELALRSHPAPRPPDGRGHSLRFGKRHRTQPQRHLRFAGRGVEVHAGLPGGHLLHPRQPRAVGRRAVCPGPAHGHQHV